MCQWAAACFALVVVLWTALPLWRHEAWWVRIFDFPRIQVAVLTALAVPTYALVGGWRGGVDRVLLATLLGCIVLQLIRIAPYTPWYPVQLKRTARPTPADQLSILVANVLMPNRNAAGLLRIIRERDPDVVLLVETDAWWQTALAPIEADYPHTLKHPLDNLYGMHLYSRLALSDPRIESLVEPDVPSMHAEVLLRSGQRVTLHCLHPAPPSPTENPTSAPRDAELLVVAKSVDARAGPVVVTGDLNDVAWSATTRLFQRVSGLLDPRVGRGMYNTFHAKYPLMRWPLDHVFCSPDFTLVCLARCGAFGSDHFPFHAVLCHTPRAAGWHEAPAADAADRERAADKIRTVGAERALVTGAAGLH